MIIKNSISSSQTIRSYYEFQSTIYDATRWSFLFGRREVIDNLSFQKIPKHIVEIGCGTGHNLRRLAAKFPDTQVTGIDVSNDMLSTAQKKLSKYPNIRLIEKAYTSELAPFETAPDAVLFSYVLSMINPHYARTIIKAYDDLAPGGKIAVVDFHSSKVEWFKKHMANNHVRMDAHLDTTLQMGFQPIQFDIRKAYAGLWNYFVFIGEKKEMKD